MSNIERGRVALTIYDRDSKRDLETFQQQLLPYPHLFQLKNCRDLKHARLRSIRDRVESERKEKLGDAEYTRMGWSRDTNLIAFISFILNEVEFAMNETEKVFVSEPHNIVALANKAEFLWLSGDKHKAICLLDVLKLAPTSDNKMTEAKAEMAYCYSRMGISYTSLAIKLFEEVVREKPGEYDWKLGLAMMLRRITNINHRIYYAVDSEGLKLKINQAIDLLTEVKHNASGELKAHASAELGHLLACSYDTETDVYIQERINVVCPGLTVLICFTEAISLDPHNVYVLTKASHFFRRQGMLKESLDVLVDALSIRKTSVVYCGLGQTYMAMVGEVKSGCNSKDIKNLKKAVYYFEKSLELDYGDRSFAHFNLGMLYKDLRDFDRALTEFRHVLDYEHSKESPLECVNAYKQCGMIKLILGNREGNVDKRAALRDEAVKFLHITLNMLCRASVRVPSYHTYLKNTWQSLHALIIDAKRDAPYREQLKERARLLHTISEHKTTLEVLDQLSSISLEQSEDSEFVEMRLDCYIKQKKFEDAVSFVSLLGVTEQSDQTMFWNNPSLPLQTFILAAREKLQSAGTRRPVLCDRGHKFDLNSDMAKKYLQWAFEYKYLSAPADGQSDKVDQESGKDWDLMILHDPKDASIVERASKVTSVLKDTCGLSVTCMFDDVPAYAVELFGVADNVEKSRLLLVMLGDKDLSLEFTQGYLAPALTVITDVSSKRHSLIVMTSGVLQSPKELKGYRSFQCPDGILADDPECFSSVAFMNRRAKEICDLFCFLVDTSIERF